MTVDATGRTYRIFHLVELLSNAISAAGWKFHASQNAPGKGEVSPKLSVRDESPQKRNIADTEFRSAIITSFAIRPLERPIDHGQVELQTESVAEVIAGKQLRYRTVEVL